MVRAAPATGGGQGAPRRRAALPSPDARLPQIDLLKGLAILSVLALHSLSAAQLADGAARFWIGQAVPVFVVLMGLNATGSMWRAGTAPLRALYSRAYVTSRLDRLYVPFLAVFALSALIALIDGTLTARAIGRGLVTGALPYSGPGNYFVTLAFEFAATFPLLYWAFRRRPELTVLACFAAGAAFELAAPQSAWLTAHASVYSAALPRFLPFISLGMLLAARMRSTRTISTWWIAGWALGALYLMLLTVDAEVITIAQAGWRALGQTFLVAGYSAGLVAAGLIWLPSPPGSALAGIVERLGRTSYEIFLVQIVWFSLASGQHLAMLPVNLVVCCAAGIALNRALRAVPSIGGPS